MPPPVKSPLVDAGQVVNYQLVMHNDFIIVGPPSDPAKIKDLTAVTDAFKAIAAQKATFISRGDKSGTHTKELSIWKAAGIDAPQRHLVSGKRPGHGFDTDHRQ